MLTRRRLECAPALLVLLAAATPAAAQSDACTSATPVTTGSYSGNTASASNDGASCGESATTPDVWFSYTASENCALQLNTCGSSYDTVLSVHSACPGTLLNTVACNDDSCALSSTVNLGAAAGATYLIRVSGWNGATGAFNLNVACAPPGADSCESAQPIGEGTFTGSTSGASADGAADCGLSASTPDTWFVFTAADDCNLRIDTCGSSYDTVLSVHSGCPGTTANQLACNDDSCALGSRVVVPVQTGVSYWIRVSGYNGQTGAFVLHTTCQEPGPPGADVYLGELTAMEQYGRVGDTIGCAIDTPLCNAGTTPLDWFANPDPRHPFMVFNMYRLEGGRIEQIGQSWAKHGFGAAQDDACGFGCTPHPDGTRLGVGCSDTYSAGLNAVQSLLGPRHEINPWTGAYVFEGSHLDIGPPANDGIDYRLQIRDADLSAVQHPGAQFVCEVYILAHDDVDHMNSVAWEPVSVSGVPGGTWNFNIGGGATNIGPALNAWSGATLATIPAQPSTDGRAILASRATDNGNGTWRYDYALYNHDVDRAVRSLQIPVPASAVVSNIAFRLVPSHGDGYSNAPWTSTRDAAGITWSTQTFAENPTASVLRWGTLYNFGFDADVAPSAAGSATLGLFKPGDPATVSGGPVQAPGGGCLGDTDSDGDVDLTDLAALLSNFGTASGAGEEDGDTDADGDVDLSDLANLLANFGATC